MATNQAAVPLQPALQPICDGLWTTDIMKSFPLGVRMPLRGTVVRLANGDLWVHSPTPLTPELGAAVDAQGPVRHLVGPSRLHHMSLGEWSARYPAAQLWATPELAKKRSDLSFAGTVPSAAPALPAPWAAEIEPLALDGAPGIGEAVFFHRASRTMICTDLLFNIRRPATAVTGFLLTLMGTKGRFAMSRVWRRYRKDRAALKASVERLLAWDFTRVIPAHGDVFEAADARDATRAALAWMLR
jgi:hypothetical protein